jgi:hypothetical protein
MKELDDALENLNPKERDVALENLSKLMFRLKAVVGWASAKNNKYINSTTRKAIRNSAITLNLTPTIHEFNIDDQGRVEFVLNYLAYVEDFYDQPTFNIFSDATITTKLLSRKLRYQTLNKACKAKEVSELRSQEKDAQKQEKEKAMQSLIKRLLGSRRVQFLTIPIEQLAAYQKEGPLGQSGMKADHYFNQILGQMPTPVEDGSPEMKQIVDEMKTRTSAGEDATAPMPVNFIESVNFFYAADLIDVILDGIQETLAGMDDTISNLPDSIWGGADAAKMGKQQQKALYLRYKQNFEKLRVVLGPMELISPKPKSGILHSNFICMGDVPISVRYFIEWLTKKMLKKEEARYSLPKFLNDFFNEFLRNFLNNDTCFDNVAKQPTRLAQSSLTAYANKKRTDAPTGYVDEITAAIQRNASSADYVPSRLYTNDSKLQSPVLSCSGVRDNEISNPGFAKEINYLVYFVARTQPTETMKGTKSVDQKRGIWHYEIGKPVGIVKTINLTKTDSPGLKELRFEQQGYDGLQQLREMYDAKISTYADVSAYPGNYIYIEPGGFSPSAKAGEWDLTQFGIGGYYMIVRSEHTFGAGQADTVITAKWVAELEKNATAEAKKLEAEGAGKKSPAKCYAPDTRQGKARAEAAESSLVEDWIVNSSWGKFWRGSGYH